MNITELDSFNLADTVKFHDRLNPRLWDGGEHLQSDVREKLLEIARDFQEFLGVPDLDVKDITVSGSNAAYNYTPNSDIDLHLVVDLPEADNSEVYRELFDAKKFQYNNIHNIKIGGYDVELYVQNPNEEHHSQGIYSLLRNAWISVPKRRKAEIDDISAKSKYEDLAARIEDTVRNGDHNSMAALMKKIKAMRQNGLDKHGELGADNLAFKLLRNNGYIKKLVDARNAARDRELSLAELARPKQKVTYGFVSESPDGVNPSTKMFLEEPGGDNESTVREFIDFVAERLGITQMPEIELHTDPEWSKQNKSFGRYTPETHTLEVNLANRHIMDILRTTAHELVHCRQNQESQLPGEAGATGSRWENQAHAIAGVIMRDYADQHPEMFDGEAMDEAGGYADYFKPPEPQSKEKPQSRIFNAPQEYYTWQQKQQKPEPAKDKKPVVGENASGYIPKNKKEARDPRYSMAVSVDVGPGQVGKEANKLGLQTGKNGEPGSLMNPAKKLAESLYKELQIFEDQDLFEIKMTGKNLSQLAKNIKGVKVGLEFEMIVPNVNDDDDSDQEPDYDFDERVRDIDDAIGFFDDGDHNWGSIIRNVREEMEDNYQTWVMEQMDEDWFGGNGMEFFQEFLDREYPFDRDEGLEAAEDYVRENNPDLEPGTDEYQQAVSERLNELEANYYVEQWEEQGRYYDYAREEWEDEQRGNYSEQDWLENQGIRYASDVINEYTDLTWPHWTSSGGDAEGDIKGVALSFMDAMGMNSVAISTSYHGSYEKWNGSDWVRIGSAKPDDCFTIEPDGSLEGNESDDAGLEFVSPPIPLEDVGTVMSKVQAWAGANGVYTGKSNKTSIHTNISIPGYSIENLDYLKAALLLGDEHVLRQFDRIGNSYAKPAIEKIQQLVNQKPEKAKELLDKMKSQLNAEASKLIHSGVTDKFTSINTKDNRIEFRSPGGDYLSDIADNPRKMQDTINRMVVAMDAAMDPNKYKEEYQKKLYKMLTGQQFGREAKTGAKQEPKKDTNDLLNIFSRYAAGELPKAALKSFVRQAQLERKLAKGKDQGMMWWNVQWDNGRRMEVVAGSAKVAKQVAAEEWDVPESQLAGAVVTPLRPYEEKPQQQGTTVAGRPNNPEGNWYLKNGDTNEVFYRFNASDYADAYNVLQQWKQENPDSNINAMYGRGRDESAQQSAPVPGSTLDLQRQRASQAQQNQGNWGIWINANDRFANQPGTYARGETPPLYRFPSQEAAEQWIEQQRAERPNMRTDIEVREIEPARQPVTDIDLFSEFNTTRGDLTPRGPGPWEIYRISDGSSVRELAHTNRAAAETEARTALGLRAEAPELYGVRTRQQAQNDAAQGGIVDVAGEQPTQAPRTLTVPGHQPGQVFTGEWKVMVDGEEVYKFSGVGNSQADANRVGRDWVLRQIRQGTLSPGDGADIEILPVMEPA